MIGTKLGPYTLVRELGTGGMGTVYLGQAGDDQVAVKVIHPHLLATTGFFKRFLREAEFGRTVSHDNVVKTLDVDAISVDDRLVHFLVMEYVEGQTLRELLADLERVPEELCRHVGREIAKGLAAMHGAGVVHRDLKPENVLITPDHAVKIMDLGVARIADERIRLSQTGDFAGSVPYAAPEQFLAGGDGVDAHADQFALGILLYELGTGEHPFPGDDAPSVMRNVLAAKPRRISDRNPQLTPFFEEVVHTLLARHPEDRFPDAANLADVLEAGEESEWWEERARRLLRQTRRPLRRIRIPRETSLYGRDEEIARFRALYDRATTGDGNVVLVEGEAGVGKSRLVDEFAGRLAAEGEEIQFLFGSYPPGGAATTAGAFSTALREHFGEALLGEALGECLSDSPTLVPAFVALLRGVSTPTGEESLNQDSIQACFVSAVRALARKSPVVLLIDDLHFAPDAGRALFAALALAVPGHRILLVGTFRPGVPARWVANLERLDQTSFLTLRRLGAKDLVQLLTDAFRSSKLAEDLAAKVALRSDGNPFFAFEIIRGLREGGYIERDDDGRWTALREVREITIPSSVFDLVVARVTEIEEEERDLLELAACAGFEFDPLLVGQVAGMDRIPVLKLLGRIERQHRLIRSMGSRCVFDHHQVQEALYRGLSEPLRREYHALIARAIETEEEAGERDPSDLGGGVAVDLADQFLLSGRADRADRYLDRALDHLAGTYANERALALVRRCLEGGTDRAPARRIELLLKAADLLSFTGNPDEARQSLDEALGIAEETGDRSGRARIRIQLGELLAQCGEAEAAVPVLTEAVAEADEVGRPEDRASARLQLGNAHHHLGRPAEASAWYEEALSCFEAAGSRAGAAKAIGNLGLVAWETGDLDRARDRFAAALETFRETGDRRAEANAIGMLGLVLDDLGRFAEAVEMHERHLEIAREIGYRRGAAIAMSNLADSLRMTGRLDESMAKTGESADLSEEIGDRAGALAARSNQGGTLAHVGDFAAARRVLLPAIRTARRIGEARDLAMGRYQLAYAHLQAGRLGRARRLVKRALRGLTEIGYRAGACWAAHLAGVIAFEGGDREEAVRRFREVSEAAEELGSPPLGAAAGCYLAALGEIQPAAAEAALEASLERIGPSDRAEAWFALWLGSGRKRHLEAAKDVLEGILAGLTPARRRAMEGGSRVARRIRSARRG